MPAVSIFRHSLRVTYADCTVGNHVYYARYFDFLETARGEFFRSLGFTFQGLEDEGLAFPVIHCEGDFKRAARYDHEIQIHLWLRSVERIRLDFAYRIVSDQEQVLFEGLTRHACTDLKNKAFRIPSNLIEKLIPYQESPDSVSP